MSNLYVSTSRKPSVLTRRLARALSLLLGAKTENRGKRSVPECVERAEARGLTRVLFVYEKQGNPSELAFFDAEKGWLEPRVFVKGIKWDSKENEKGRRLSGEVKITSEDKQGERLSELFGFDEPETEDVTEMVLSSGAIKFFLGKKRVGPVIEIEVK